MIHYQVEPPQVATGVAYRCPDVAPQTATGRPAFKSPSVFVTPRHSIPGSTKETGASGRQEDLSRQHADVGLVGEQTVDAGAQERHLLVNRPAVRVRVGAGTEVGRQELVLRAEGVRMQHEARSVRVGDQ